MKKTYKIILKLLSFALFFMLFSCEKDLYDDKIYKDGLTKKKISFDEFKTHHPVAFTKFQKVEADCEKARKRKKNVNGKLVYDSNLGFYIDTEKIVYMEKDGYKSFTFPIKRVYPEEKLENLVMSFINETDYKSYIAKYDLTLSEKEQLLNEEMVANIKSKTSIEDFEGNQLISNGVVDKGRLVLLIDGVCYVINDIWVDPYGDIHASIITCHGCCNGAGVGGASSGEGTDSNGGGGESGSTNGSSSSGESSTGNNGDSGDNSGGNTGYNNSGNTGESTGLGNTGGGGATGTGTSSNNNAPSTSGTPQTNPHQLGYINPHTGILTVPCVLMEDDETPPPCDVLKSLTDNTKVTTGINFLKTKIHADSEFGYEIERNLDPTTGDPVLDTHFQAGGAFSGELEYGANVIGAMHNHPENGQAIPSWGDLRWLQLSATAQRYHRNDGYNVSIVVVKDPNNPNASNIYAITIDNTAQLSHEINAVWDNSDFSDEPVPKTRLKNINAFFGEKFGDVQDNPAGMEVRFLNLFRNYGISLNKYNSNTNKWEKLTLHNPYNPNSQYQNNNNYTDKTPCNN